MRYSLLILTVLTLLCIDTSYGIASCEVIDIVSVTIQNNDKPTKRKHIVGYATTFKGTAYKSKKYTASGFDCSGFVQHVYTHFGIDLNRSSKEMAKQGRRKKKPEQGDLVFFANGSRINHVAIVTKVDKEGIHIIHSTSSKGVIIECLDKSSYWKQRYAFSKDVLNLK